jgi:hypothetical protein
VGEAAVDGLTGGGGGGDAAAAGAGGVSAGGATAADGAIPGYIAGDSGGGVAISGFVTGPGGGGGTFFDNAVAKAAQAGAAAQQATSVALSTGGGAGSIPLFAVQKFGPQLKSLPDDDVSPNAGNSGSLFDAALAKAKAVGQGATAKNSGSTASKGPQATFKPGIQSTGQKLGSAISATTGTSNGGSSGGTTGSSSSGSSSSTTPSHTPMPNPSGSVLGGGYSNGASTGVFTSDDSQNPVTTASAVSPVAGADLVLEDITLAAPATLVAGPAYTVKFRNQGTAAAGKFEVAILAGFDGKLTEDAPRAVFEAASLAAGDVKEVTLRLPQKALKLPSADGTPAGFTHLFVAVDLLNTIAETDETNNTAVVERAALEGGVAAD